MSRTESQKRARKRYMEKCRKLHVTLYPSESDLIDRIDHVTADGGTYSGYIKSLIYKDIARENAR